MDNIDYDDLAIEEQWCNKCRHVVLEYLASEGVEHGQIGEWPAWHVSPYVSIWAVESLANPGWVGWWVICGDLPTDYISSDGIRNPRDVARAIGLRWQEVASYMSRGKRHPEMNIGSEENWQKLAPLLSARAKILVDYADDDKIWDE